MRRSLNQLPPCILLATFLLTMPVAAQAPGWEGLEHGRHAVGFRVSWQFDSSRTFNLTFPDGSRFAKGKTSRPVLVQVWYPAKRPAHPTYLSHSDYLSLPEAGRIRSLAEYLSRRNREVAAAEVIGQSIEKMDTGQRDAWEAFLHASTDSILNAAPLKGAFPLVIYIQGAGSSTDDNLILLEFLASHGYVVVNSAYQGPDGEMIAHGYDIVADDISFLVGYARRLPNVDWSRVAVVGHSAGAQTALVYASRGGSAADALVSLDNTADYYFSENPIFRKLYARVDAKAARTPMLFAAGMSGIFQLADSLGGTPRAYLTFRDAAHEEFISQGIDHSRVSADPRLPAVQRKYAVLCRQILAFLNENLRGGSPARGSAGDEERPALPGGDVFLETAPPGVLGPPAYEPDSDHPPTPRQMRDLAMSGQVPVIIKVLKRFRESEEAEAIRDEQLAFSIVQHFLEIGDRRNALRVAHAYHAAEPKISITSASYVTWGKILSGWGNVEAARDFFRIALLMNPGDLESSDGLSRLPSPVEPGIRP
jgi:pimeloyl-ACP methyl ester carboxylesterase